MFDPRQLPYEVGNDTLQTRRRHPRTTPPNFAFYCDWIIWSDDHTHADPSITPRTIYVRSEPESLNRFVSDFLGRVSSPFALVTSSHDLTMPLGFEREFGFLWRTLVENEFMKVWFTENRDLDHPKIEPLTLGIPSPDLPSWVSEIEGEPDPVWTAGFFDWVSSIRSLKKKFKIFGCWHSRTGHFSGTCPEGDDERAAAYRHFESRPDLFDWFSPGIDRAEYVEKMAAYQFVLCPHGGGLDPNPRCWEALLAGSIPIVKRNLVSEALADLPVAVVDDWEEVEEENLREWQVTFQPILEDRSTLEFRMSNRYYFEKILARLDRSDA